MEINYPSNIRKNRTLQNKKIVLWTLITLAILGTLFFLLWWFIWRKDHKEPKPGPHPVPSRYTPGPAPYAPGPAPHAPGPAPHAPGPAPRTPGPAPRTPGPAPYAHQVQHHTHRVQHHTHRVQHHTHRVQHHTHRVQHHTHRVQHHTHRVQHHTHRVQHHTSPGPAPHAPGPAPGKGEFPHPISPIKTCTGGSFTPSKKIPPVFIPPKSLTPYPHTAKNTLSIQFQNKTPAPFMNLYGYFRYNIRSKNNILFR